MATTFATPNFATVNVGIPTEAATAPMADLQYYNPNSTSNSNKSEFTKGFLRGIDELQALGGGALGLIGDITGIDPLKQFGFDIYQEQMAQAEENPAAVGSLEDINSFGSFLDWALGTAGEVLPSALGAIASSGTGAIVAGSIKTVGKQTIKKLLTNAFKKKVASGVLGRTAAKEVLEDFGKTATGKIVRDQLQSAAKSYATRQIAKRGAQAGVLGFSSALESGGNWIDDFQTNQENTNPAADLLFGLASGATELFGGEGLAISKVFGPTIGARLAKRVGKEAAKDVEKGFAKILVTEIGKSALAEGSQEALQESLSILNSYLNTHSIDAVVTPQTFSQLANAFAGGMIGGITFGTIGGSKEAFSASKEAASIRQQKELEAKVKTEFETNKVKAVQERKNQVDELIARNKQFLSSVDQDITPDKFIQAMTAQAALSKESERLDKELGTTTEEAKKNIANLAEPVGAQFNQEILNERNSLLDQAHSTIDKFVSDYNTQSLQKQTKLREHGVTASRIEALEAMRLKVFAKAKDLVAKLEALSPYDSHRIIGMVQNGMADLHALSAKDTHTYTQSLGKYSDLTPEQAREAERAARQKDAFDSGAKSEMAKMQAEAVADRAAAYKAKAMEDEFRNSMFQREAQRAFPQVGSERNTLEYLNSLTAQRQIPTVSTPTRETLPLSNEEAARSTFGSFDGSNRFINRPIVPDEGPSGVSSGDPSFSARLTAGRKTNLYNILKDRSDNDPSKPAYSWNTINNMSPAAVKNAIDKVRAGTFGVRAQQMLQDTVGTLYQGEAEIKPNVSALMAKALDDKSLAKAKDMRDVINILSDTLSEKNMPYSKAEAEIVLEALLPNALNLKPTEGITWLRNSLLVVPEYIDNDALEQSVFHGSPYRGIERTGFNTDRIGSGEGFSFPEAWGIFTTSSKDVAELYAKQNNKYSLTVDGVEQYDIPQSVIRLLKVIKEDPNRAAVEIADRNEFIKKYPDAPLAQVMQATYEQAKGFFNTDYGIAKIGQVYELEIPESNNFISYDASLSKQEYVLQKIEPLLARFNISPDINGRTFYTSLSRILGSQEKASLALLEAGIPGIKFKLPAYKAENFVVFSPSDIDILNTYYQGRKAGENIRGTYTRKMGKIIIGMLKASDKSTFLHETAHAYLDNLVQRATDNYATARELSDLNIVKEWLGWKEGQEAFTREQHEKFARGFEKYLMTNKAPSSKLAKFFELVKKWLMDIYKTADALNVDISPAAKRVYDHMLLGEKQRKAVSTSSNTQVQEGRRLRQTATERLQSAGTGIVNAAKELPKAAARAMDAENRSFLKKDGGIDYTFWDTVKEQLQDNYHPMTLMLGAIKEKKGTITLKSNVAAIEEAIPNEMSANLKKFESNYIRPTIDLVLKYAEEVKSTTPLKDVDKYLQALHAGERNKKINSKYKGPANEFDAASGMSDDEANRILAGKSSIKITKSLDQVARAIHDINNQGLDIMEKFNLIPKEQIERMRNAYNFYVPLKGTDQLLESIDPHYKERMKGPEVKLFRAMGRKEGSTVDSPLVNSILQTMDLIQVRYRVKTGRALLELINDNPQFEGEKFFFEKGTKEKIKSHLVYNKKGDLVFVQDEVPFRNDPRAVTVIDETGHKIRLLAPDQRVANAFTGNNLAVAGPIIKLIGAVTRAMAKLATTLNPGFIYTNPVRDVATAALNITDEKYDSGKYNISEEKLRRDFFSKLHSSRKAIAEYLKGKKPSDPALAKILEEFIANGAYSDQYALNDFDSLHQGIENELRSLRRKSDNKFQFYTVNAIKGIGQFLEMQSASFENMTRFAVFRALSDAWMKKGMPEDEAYLRAARAARNITVNFSKRGALSPVLGPLFMFSNASIQGTARMMRTLLRKHSRKTMMKILAGSVGGLMLMGMMNKAIGGEDDDGVSYYDKIPNWVKNNNFIFMLPGGQYFKIPMPYGYALFNTFAQQSLDVLSGKTTPFKAAIETTYSAFDNFSPVGSPEAGWTTLVPTVLRPIFQIETNKGFFGQKIMPDVPSWVEYDYPDSRRYWSTVNTPLKWIAIMLSNISGGSEVEGGFVDISPETLEHIVESYTGGLGKLFTRSINVATSLYDGVTGQKDVALSDIYTELPIARRFLGKTNFFSTLHTYTEEKADVRAKEAEYKLLKARNTKEAVEFRNENKDFFIRLAIVNAADKQLRSLRKVKNSILRSSRAHLETARILKIENTERKIIQDTIKRLRSVKD